MMQANNRALKRYYRQVRKMLPCTRSAKDRLERQIRCSVENFISEHPEADISAIRAHFGEPQTVAAAYIETAETEELLRQFNIRKKIVFIAACAVLAILLSWSGVILFAIQEARTGDEVAVIELHEGEIISYDQSAKEYTVIDSPGDN